MPVHKPGRVLLHHVPLKFVRSRVAGGGRKSVDVSIALVPFIDFLIVLVVFLLTSFGNQVIAQTQDDTMTLPGAINTTDLEEAPVITVNRLVVMLEGRRIADTQSLAENPATQRIEQLVVDLDTLKKNWSAVHQGKPFPGQVILQADKNTDFRVIKKVMFSAAQAGYANLNFAVNKKAAE
ncbi:MAG: biopolymer transporter ExbD [Polyangiales bacterium]|nr:biopolymer transporter ExbD [Myxococcales bacterium]